MATHSLNLSKNSKCNSLLITTSPLPWKILHLKPSTTSAFSLVSLAQIKLPSPWDLSPMKICLTIKFLNSTAESKKWWVCWQVEFQQRFLWSWPNWKAFKKQKSFVLTLTVEYSKCLLSKMFWIIFLIGYSILWKTQGWCWLRLTLTRKN